MHSHAGAWERESICRGDPRGRPVFLNRWRCWLRWKGNLRLLGVFINHRFHRFLSYLSCIFLLILRDPETSSGWHSTLGMKFLFILTTLCNPVKIKTLDSRSSSLSDNREIQTQGLSSAVQRISALCDKLLKYKYMQQSAGTLLRVKDSFF